MNYIVNPSDFPFVDEYFREYAMHLPYLYEHREEIFANAEYFYTPLPYGIYGLNKSVCIGALLRAFDRGKPYRIASEDNNNVEFIASFAGNPMSGTTSGWKVVVANNTVKAKHFRCSGFLSYVYHLAKCFNECDMPYQESSINIHDIIKQLKEHEGNNCI